MHERLSIFWQNIRATFWFIPTLMVLSAILIASISIGLDRSVDTVWAPLLLWSYTGGPEGARALLSAIAGSMIGVAGTTFSITIAALTLASSQFGPRLLGNFVRDRGNQIVLGTFIATFLYCLLVLRTVRTTNEEFGVAAFVPQISITIAVFLAIACIGVLIYFIHHVAQDIQADHVVASVSHDLQAAIVQRFPEQIGTGEVREQLAESDQKRMHHVYEHGLPLLAQTSGYVQAVDGEAILKIAQEHNLLVAIMSQPGSFIIQHTPIAFIDAEHAVSDDLRASLMQTFVIGSQRTTYQDILFGIDQLVEIAVRALSPGINDPFTAVTCINHLGIAMCELAQRQLPAAYRHDAHGTLRVVAEPVQFAPAIERAFGQIRHYGRDNRVVLGHMVDVLARISSCVVREDDRAAVTAQLQLIQEVGQESLPDSHERSILMGQVQRVLVHSIHTHMNAQSRR